MSKNIKYIYKFIEPVKKLLIKTELDELFIINYLSNLKKSLLIVYVSKLTGASSHNDFLMYRHAFTAWFNKVKTLNVLELDEDEEYIEKRKNYNNNILNILEKIKMLEKI